jgi:hypothetical protein
LNDDLTEVLAAVAAADLLLLATPVYFGEISSQLKGFHDAKLICACGIGPATVDMLPEPAAPGRRNSPADAGLTEDILTLLVFAVIVLQYKSCRLIVALVASFAGHDE